MVSGEDGGALGNGEGAGVGRGVGDAAGGAIRLADGECGGAGRLLRRDSGEGAAGGYLLRLLPVEAVRIFVVGYVRVAAPGAAVAQCAAFEFLRAGHGQGFPLALCASQEIDGDAVHGLLNLHELVPPACRTGENDFSGHKDTLCFIICRKTDRKSTSIAS